MGKFTQFDDVNFLLCERQFDFVGVARGSIAITDWVIQFGGRSPMQALILCCANIGGIGWNPERVNGAYLHLDRAETRSLHLLTRAVQGEDRLVSEGAGMLPRGLMMG
jgi:hypothetical protein